VSKKIFATSSLSSLGCTFLDWSLHYLSGKNNYYNAKLDKNISLVSNPLSLYDKNSKKFNAHAHKKNYAGGEKEVKDFVRKVEQQIKKVESEDFSNMYSVYFAGKHFSNIVEDMEYDIDKLSECKKCLDKVENYFYKDYKICVDFLHDCGIPIIYIDNSKHYFFDIRQTDTFFASGKQLDEPDLNKIFDEYMHTFFSDSLEIIDEKNIWDVREILALSIRPYNNRFKEKIGFSFPYYHIDFRCWWFDPISSVVDIADFLEIKIDNSRWEKWKDVCLQWKDNHVHYLNFYFSLDHIIDSIINGWYYELSNLSLQEEAIIQHMLIYKHNLNLKTWQLKKFPPNTQDLHELLEDNIHKVPKLY